ncbi:hypothetical protein LTR96_011151 [Exophiala xenobiotica]|nr:hypothetical protein LTR47_011632 [Exophiala xenobiotica]KAK5263435.1 hypothetical protein LTR96_011151 [Exophiala xenobiotica]KAK5332667.1 hypothetical protein LTR98_011197 [Exophiala xenobiotica]KAK5357376.1 hypothetical protein LTS03_011605 [Exophiala xenobiotica]KAK5444237.1 hypothetical protein LTR55_012289 [Exophiala xenobiotica]
MTDAEVSDADPTSRTRRLKHYLSVDLRVDWLIEIQLLLLTFGTGVQDAISFPDFHCFASNQTGNTVILAVGLAGLGGDLFDIANVGISLALFIGGAIMTGQIANIVGARRRAWLIFSHLLQTVMAFGAAAIAASHDVQESGPWAQSAIALLAFSSGAQVASMRPLRVQEITTAMATAAWVDLVVDPKLFAIHNHSRDRRALFLAALVAGSFAGAYAHFPIGSSNTLILSAVSKLLVTVTLLFNRNADIVYPARYRNYRNVNTVLQRRYSQIQRDDAWGIQQKTLTD